MASLSNRRPAAGKRVVACCPKARRFHRPTQPGGLDQRDLAKLSAVELAAMIRTRKVSPVEVTQAFLTRIERHNPSLNAFVTMHSEEALCAAEKAEEALMSGQQVGPLHGVPLHVKDILFVAGSRTTFGSKLTESNVTSDDCGGRAAAKSGDDSCRPDKHARAWLERGH